MGKYDSIIAKCPGCGKGLDWRSNGGDCVLDTFPADKVPLEIAIEFDGERTQCPGCGKIYVLRAPRTVPMEISMAARQEE